MSQDLSRRAFIAAVPATIGAAAMAVNGLSTTIDAAPAAASIDAVKPAAGTIKIEPFDYEGVKLLPSRWLNQYTNAHETYLAIPVDDILHGFRAEAGLAAPGQAMGGWAQRGTGGVFGQWLSGMSRGYKATGDTALRDRAVLLATEWAKTIKPDGDPRMRHYAYDKLACGLVDLHRYAGYTELTPVLARTVDFAAKSFQKPAPDYNPRSYAAPTEWYTLSENLYRAYALTGEARFRDFAQQWHYPAYWNRFSQSSMPDDAHGVHAYSHVNTFTSAAAAYEVTGDPQYLTIVRNFYDYMQHAQTFATGGYGPNEQFVKVDGSLGASLDTRSDTCETGCGSWAVYKLSRYLQRFTGEARYGDWAERMLYNGAGAALPVTTGGKNFYYADYRVGGGMKVYNFDLWTCCSGTYIQDVADYHNLGYYKDAQGIYVNMYIPSELTWTGPKGKVVFTQTTKYPDAETSTIAIKTAQPASFAIRFRIPEWTKGAVVSVNGTPAHVASTPGTWATVQREWKDGDSVEITIPLTLRMLPVDRWHPDRLAIARGPVVLVLEAGYHDSGFRLPANDEELAAWMTAEAWQPEAGVRGHAVPPEIEKVSIFRLSPPSADGSAPRGRARARFRAFYDVDEGYPYLMYFDRKDWPRALW